MFSLFKRTPKRQPTSILATTATKRTAIRKTPATESMAPASPAQEEAVIQLERACLRAETSLGITLTRPRLRFDIRGKTAGMAYFELNLIRLNPTLLEQNPDNFFTEVIPHELCHIIAFILHGRVKPHGAEWQNLMRRVFGLSPRTTHNLDTSAVSRSITYRCGCAEVSLSIRRHNKVVRNQTRYLCRKCGQYLTRAASSD